MTERVQVGGIQIAKNLYDFVNNEAIPGTGIDADKFWAEFDKIVNEPLGGAHRDPKAMATMLKRTLAESLRQFQGMSVKELQARRHERLMAYGKFKETGAQE